MSKPFSRVIAMFALIRAAMGDSRKLAAIGPYKSRGHGRNKPFVAQVALTCKRVRGTTYTMNGARECARRAWPFAGYVRRAA